MLRAVEKVLVNGCCIMTSARSATPLTVTVMLPEESRFRGSDHLSGRYIRGQRDGDLLPLMSVTTTLFVVTVLASGASLKVMVILVVGLTQFWSGNGLTSVTLNGELSVSSRVVNGYRS